MYTTTAKFNSVCAETGKKIRKGDSMLYDKTTRKCYTTDSNAAKNESERQSLMSYVDAQENAYFDNFCRANNI